VSGEHVRRSRGEHAVEYSGARAAYGVGGEVCGGGGERHATGAKGEICIL